jgi:hypothetical protein
MISLLVSQALGTTRKHLCHRFRFSLRIPHSQLSARLDPCATLSEMKSCVMNAIVRDMTWPRRAGNIYAILRALNLGFRQHLTNSVVSDESKNQFSFEGRSFRPFAEQTPVSVDGRKKAILTFLPVHMRNRPARFLCRLPSCTPFTVRCTFVRKTRWLSINSVLTILPVRRSRASGLAWLLRELSSGIDRIMLLILQRAIISL